MANNKFPDIYEKKIPIVNVNNNVIIEKASNNAVHDSQDQGQLIERSTSEPINFQSFYQKKYVNFLQKNNNNNNNNSDKNTKKEEKTEKFEIQERNERFIRNGKNKGQTELSEIVDLEEKSHNNDFNEKNDKFSQNSINYLIEKKKTKIIRKTYKRRRTL